MQSSQIFSLQFSLLPTSLMLPILHLSYCSGLSCWEQQSGNDNWSPAIVLRPSQTSCTEHLRTQLEKEAAQQLLKIKHNWLSSGILDYFCYDAVCDTYHCLYPFVKNESANWDLPMALEEHITLTPLEDGHLRRRQKEWAKEGCCQGPMSKQDLREGRCELVPWFSITLPFITTY